MQFLGVNYGTGLDPKQPWGMTRENVRQHLQLAKNMNAGCVRINGFDLERMKMVGDVAADLGLEVWLSPRFLNVTVDVAARQLVPFAAYAEELRKRTRVMFIVGNELTLDAMGLMPGRNYGERARSAGAFMRIFLAPPKQLTPYPKVARAINEQRRRTERQLNSSLTGLVRAVRKKYRGDVTYAKAAWEKVKWARFSVACMNMYMSQWNREQFAELLAAELKATGKPCILTEFGTASFKGALDHGGSAWQYIEEHPNLPYDEETQIAGLTEQLRAVGKAELNGCFVWQLFEHNERGYGITKLLQNGNLEPKRSAGIVSEFYSAWLSRKPQATSPATPAVSEYLRRARPGG